MNKWFNGCTNLRFAIAERIATITLDRPERKNALTLQMLDGLRAALLEADDRQDVSVIVLEAEGNDFCSGYDLQATYDQKADSEVADTPLQPAPRYRGTLGGGIDDDSWRIERTQEQMRTLVATHKPVIAKVQGRCLAGGMDLALYCDVVIAADDAHIGFPATRANGTPANQMWMYHIGPQWTKRLLFTGDVLTGRDAAVLGLVLDAVPREKLDDVVMKLARRIALVDTDLLAAHKRIVNLAMELAGANTLVRLGAEMDARAHLSRGPRAQAFSAEMRTSGLRQAVAGRDQDFGDSVVRLQALGSLADAKS